MRVLVLGAGKIGSLVAGLIGQEGDYQVALADVDADSLEKVAAHYSNLNVQTFPIDASDGPELERHLKHNPADAVVSSLPYYCNTTVGHVARKVGLHYFDLTEDVSVTEAIKRISEGAETAFAPQCGLAPGFISIVANELMTHFDQVNDVRMRVGALPQNPNNALKYSLTWSTEGLINEYGNLCFGIDNYKPASLMPLEGLESIEIDGKKYEAFNTSGGLGSLAETYEGQIRKMNYKTIRYPGHCVQMRLLMNDLKLNEDRKTFRRILENAIPRTVQDVVIIYASVTGRRDGHLIEENYVNKVYPKLIGERLWSAIQVTTAAGVCAVLDLVIRDPGQYTGFVPQESFNLKDVLDNRFGRYFAHGSDMTESARLVATNEVRSVM